MEMRQLDKNNVEITLRGHEPNLYAHAGLTWGRHPFRLAKLLARMEFEGLSNMPEEEVQITTELPVKSLELIEDGLRQEARRLEKFPDPAIIIPDIPDAVPVMYQMSDDILRYRKSIGAMVLDNA